LVRRWTDGTFPTVRPKLYHAAEVGHVTKPRGEDHRSRPIQVTIFAAKKVRTLAPSWHSDELASPLTKGMRTSPSTAFARPYLVRASKPRLLGDVLLRGIQFLQNPHPISSQYGSKSGVGCTENSAINHDF